MSSNCISSAWPRVSQHVGSYCHYLKMVWVHARLVFTQMVNGHSFGDGPTKKFIRKPMGDFHNSRALANCHASISTALGASPNPTRVGFLDVPPKPLLNRTKTRRAMRIADSLPSHVVLAAHSSAHSTIVAPSNNTILDWSRHLPNRIRPHLQSQAEAT